MDALDDLLREAVAYASTWKGRGAEIISALVYQTGELRKSIERSSVMLAEAHRSRVAAEKALDDERARVKQMEIQHERLSRDSRALAHLRSIIMEEECL